MNTLFQKGLELFNEGKFFEAHEDWEILWKTLEQPEKDLLQSLILGCGHFIHLEKKNYSPAQSTALNALEKLKQARKHIEADYLFNRNRNAFTRTHRKSSPILTAVESETTASEGFSLLNFDFRKFEFSLEYNLIKLRNFELDEDRVIAGVLDRLKSGPEMKVEDLKFVLELIESTKLEKSSRKSSDFLIPKIG